jgi:hypothetical protein
VDLPVVLQAPATAPGGTPRDLHQLATAGNLRFVLGFSQAREYTAGLQALVRIPRSPAWLAGMYSADGVATPLVDIERWATRAPAADSVPANSKRYNALRLADGTDSWAIRLSQPPVVLDLATTRHEPVSNALPLHISAAFGAVMPFATHALTLADGAVALQLDWPALALALRQELSGMAAPTN